MKTKFLLSIFYLLCTTLAFSQWNGSTGTTGDTYREGNVGIGTTSPTSKLSIRNVGGTDGVKLLDFSENNDEAFLFKGNFLGTGANGNSIILGSGVTGWQPNIMTWRGDGNVGIGTTNPTSKLQVMGDTAIDYGKALKVDTDWNGNGGDNILKTGYDASRGGDYLDLYVPGNGEHHKNVKFTIIEAGNVGIGVADPKNKLSVNGTIWAKEVKVSLTDAADWVFEDDYKLRSLEEVDEFIKSNKHLPDIPSAEEFRAQDLNVAEMDNKLLQKIEELTLYLIEQNKKLEAQNKKVEEQNSKLETQQAKIEELERKIER